MSAIIKEYLILIILAALAVVGLIWYARRQVSNITQGVKVIAKEYGEDFNTVTTPSNWFNAVTGIFKNPRYISQAEQRAKITKIHENLFKK